MALSVDLPVHRPPGPQDPVPPRRHPSQHRVGRRAARVTIDVVEGRGIWVELDGDFVDGALDQVDARLARLAQLGFEVVVVGTDRVLSIDAVGARLLGRFVDQVRGLDGTVVIVDPHGTFEPAPAVLALAFVTRDRPGGAWWLGS